MEYGKLCESAQGSILPNAESGVLGHSLGFPAELLSAGRPRAWRLGDSPVEIDFARRTGDAYLVQPFPVGASVVRVAAHFARRWEMADGGGRDYWRARFVCDPSGQTAAARLIAALIDEPLEGWTKWDRAEPLALAEHAPGSALLEEHDESFCAEASRHFEAHRCVGIMAPVPRQDFMAMAARIEELLPPPLRAMFGLGWNVSRERTTGFALSCARAFARDVVAYDRARRRWTSASQEPPLAQREEPPVTEGARALEFGGREAQQRLCSGQQRWDAQRRYEKVEAWLRGAIVEDPWPSIEAGSSASEVEPLLELAVRQLEQPGCEPLSESLIVRLLKRHPSHAAYEQIARGPGANARALAAVIKQDVVALLHALPARTGALPPWTRERIAQTLDLTFDAGPAAAAAHASVLVAGAPAVPEYRSWLRAEGSRLALTLVALAPEDVRRDALRRLREYAPQQEVFLAYALAYDAPPPGGADIEPQSKAFFEAYALRRWKGRTAGDRDECDRALQWLCELQIERRVPLLRGSRPLADEFEELARELELGLVSNGLLSSLAARMILFWPAFAPAVLADPSRWRAALSLWPQDLRALLVPGEPRSSAPALADPRCKEQCERVKFDLRELDDVGMCAVEADAFASEAGNGPAKLYLDWCGRMLCEPRGSGISVWVHWLWYDAELAIAEPPAGRYTHVLWCLDRARPLTRERVEQLWRTVRSPGQALMLLRLYGPPRRPPSVDTLVVVLSLPRRELMDVLDSRASSETLGTLDICRHAWQSLELANGAECALWDDRFERTMLTGLFVGLPHERAAPLVPLLDFFAKREAESSWALGQKYLERRRNAPEYEECKRVLWREFVEPTCLNAGLTVDDLKALAECYRRRRKPHNVTVCETSTEPFAREGSQLFLSSTVSMLIAEVLDLRR